MGSEVLVLVTKERIFGHDCSGWDRCGVVGKGTKDGGLGLLKYRGDTGRGQ